MLKLKKSIIGILVFTLLLQNAPLSLAYFSPVLSEVAGVAQSNIRNARAKNGTGSFTNIVQKFYECPENNKDCATGVSGDFLAYWKKIASFLSASLLMDFLADPLALVLDPFTLAFGALAGKGGLSSCMRDDLWALEDLQNAVTQELFKAALLSDQQNTEALWNDYQRIRDTISNVKCYYRNPEKENKDNECLQGETDTLPPFFPADAVDYYESFNCPYNEFESAARDVIQSWEQNIYYTDDLDGDGIEESHWFTTLGHAYDWGNLKEMAQAGARRKAAAWIAKNTLKFGAGGPEGGNSTSLLGPDSQQALSTDFNNNDDFDVSLEKSLVRIKDRAVGSGSKTDLAADKIKNKALTMWQDVKNLCPLSPLFSWKEYFGVNPETAECVIYRCGKYWDDCNETELAEFKEGRCEKCESTTEKSLYEVLDIKARQKKDWEATQDLIEKNYKVSFSAVGSEPYMFELYDTLAKMNAEVEATYLKKETLSALPALYDNLYVLIKNQCVNEQ